MINRSEPEQIRLGREAFFLFIGPTRISTSSGSSNIADLYEHRKMLLTFYYLFFSISEGIEANGCSLPAM